MPGPTPVRGRALGLDEDEDGDGDTPIAARRMGDVAQVGEEVDRTGAVVNLDDTLEFVLSGGRKVSDDDIRWSMSLIVVPVCTRLRQDRCYRGE